MKKLYESPEFEYKIVRLSADILVVSVDEATATGGTIIDPDNDMIDNGNGDW